jgi:hypothetical protein
MKETYNMWRMIRFLYKRQDTFASWDTELGGKSEDMGEVITHDVRILIQVLSQMREPRVNRLVLAASFGGALKKIEKEQEAILSKGISQTSEQEKGKNLQLRKIITNANGIIDSCIGLEFIRTDEKDQRLIYLLPKGKKFSTVFGLIKEWLIVDIGLTWSIIIVLILGAVGGFTTKNVWKLVIFIFKSIGAKIGL